MTQVRVIIECKGPEGNSQEMSLGIQVGYLGEEGILWSLSLNVHLSYQHLVHSDVPTLIGDKERGNQAMGLCLPCDGFCVAEIGMKMHRRCHLQGKKRGQMLKKGNLQLER